MTEMGVRTRPAWARTALAVAALCALSACEEGANFSLFNGSGADAGSGSSANSGPTSVRLVERDVEAPEVFQATDEGLWDGRPSLGGVWVAHPDVGEPERVIIRNTENSNFVIGALFRRERDAPGPVIQVSSDAAEALGMLAGAPAALNVTALRREEAPDPAAAPQPEATGLTEAETVETTSLDPIAGAADAIDAAETEIATAAPVAAPVTSSLSKPYIQIGIFSVEQNANNTATAMRQAGMVPTVKKQSSSGKTFWRVLVGPATTSDERSELLRKIKGVGFEDAYAVSN